MKKLLILISLICLFLVGCSNNENAVSSSIDSDNEVLNNTNITSSNKTNEDKKYFSIDFHDLTKDLYDNYKDTGNSVALRSDDEEKIYYVVLWYYQPNDIDSETHMPSDNKDREILSNIDIEEIEKNNKKFNKMIKEYPDYKDWRVITRIENDGKCLLEIDE